MPSLWQVYADLSHYIGSNKIGKVQQASAVPHIVRRGMKQGVISSQWFNKPKVLDTWWLNLP